MTLAALATILTIPTPAGGTAGSQVVRRSCDTPVEIVGGERNLSSATIPNAGVIDKLRVQIPIEVTGTDPYSLALIYGTTRIPLGSYHGSVYMLLDADAGPLCGAVCSDGCGSAASFVRCRPDSAFYGVLSGASASDERWDLEVRAPPGVSGAIDQWSLLANLSGGNPVTPKRKYWGGLTVSAAYILLLGAYSILIVQGFRLRTYGMPMLGQVALLGVTILTLPFVGPKLEPCLFQPLLRARYDFDPSDESHVVGARVAWYGGFVLQAVVFGQYLVWGRKLDRAFEFLKTHFYKIAFTLLLLFTLTEYLFVVYYLDYYVNEIYPIATLIMAVSYLGSLFSRRRGQGLSVSVAWCWAFGTLFLYIGIMLGQMDEAFHDHLDTGYGFIHWIYWLSISTLFAYALDLTRKRLRAAPGEPRPCL